MLIIIGFYAKIFLYMFENSKLNKNTFIAKHDKTVIT